MLQFNVEMARSKIFQARTAHSSQHPAHNRPWTEEIFSFSNHGLLKNWQTPLFCLLRQNIFHGYFAFRGKISAVTILPFVEHDWLKWSCDVASTIYKVILWLCEPKTLKTLNLKSLKRGFNKRGLSHQAAINFTRQEQPATTCFAQTYILHKYSRLLFAGICHQWHVMGIALRWLVTPQT